MKAINFYPIKYHSFLSGNFAHILSINNDVKIAIKIYNNLIKIINYKNDRNINLMSILIIFTYITTYIQNIIPVTNIGYNVGGEGTI